MDFFMEFHPKLKPIDTPTGGVFLADRCEYPKDIKEKIKSEIATLRQEFRNSVGYFKVKDLQEALAHQEALKNILASIGLMKTRATT